MRQRGKKQEAEMEQKLGMQIRECMFKDPFL